MKEKEMEEEEALSWLQAILSLHSLVFFIPVSVDVKAREISYKKKRKKNRSNFKRPKRKEILKKRTKSKNKEDKDKSSKS